MNNNIHILDTLKENYDNYSNAESKVVDIVLSEPKKVVNMSIGKIASLANVSDPTIVRFCRSLGLDGFREFKIQLTKELAVRNHHVHREVEQGDNAKDYIQKIGNSTVHVLSNIVNILDYKIIEQAVFTLSNAKWIEFWGFGASAAVAEDIYHKFFRLGIPCNSYSDSHMQCMSASTLSKESVVVAISHTGRSRELIENVKLAKESGAIILGITSPNSPLAKECSQTIDVDLDEDTTVYTPMISRMSHLLILDILVVGVSLQRGQHLTNRLKNMKEALKIKRV